MNIGKQAASAMATMLAAVAISACGGDASPHGKAEPVADGKSATRIHGTYEGFVDAVYEEDFRRACTTFSEAMRQRLGGRGGCTAWLSELYGGAPLTGPRPKLESLAISGGTAHAQARTPGDPMRQPVRFVERDGEWAIDLSLDER